MTPFDEAEAIQQSAKPKSLREDIFRYVGQKYHVAPDYPFPNFPSYPVMRHKDNQKMFALIMDIPGDRLGLRGEQRVDVLNVKLGDPLLADMLVSREGYFRGYHIRGGNWISVLLDGTVPLEEIGSLIDESYMITASAKEKKSLRPPKEWLIPSNLKYYDSVHAFDAADEIDWKQGAGIRKGDTVYLYVGAPVSAILYQCQVTQTDIPFDYSEKGLTIRALMKIRVQKRYPPDQFTFAVLSDEYGIRAVRGPRGISQALSEALNG